ncbi:glutathione S-transferase family protein [Thalassotalea profundi]|uniref:Glutathione S-transferase family protein n=1 Tax=Thalassotalea profundi TaxID=2036687 RepID=A0ABQ3J4V4_9GAMM|nr:glutathione S-transferase family protein [Thalassotalea profundi]GHF01346.1 hypothetical protein GCM10011501_33550 [Thalassotalea profundi]
MLTLFTHFNVPCGHKVQLFLHELSLNYNIHPVNLRDSEHQSSWFLKLNPKAQIPVLLDDTTVICDSTEICIYLDHKFNKGKFFTENQLNYGAIQQWLDFIDHNIHHASSLLSWCIAVRPEMLKRDDWQIKQYINAIPCEDRQHRRTKALKLGINLPELSTSMTHYRLMLTKMARLLTQNNYLFGDEYSVADIVTLPYIERLVLLSFSSMWQEYPEILKWHKNMAKLKGYQTCFHDSYPPYFKERWLEYGDAAKEKLLNLDA